MYAEYTIKILLSIVLGGIIGAEREIRSRSAGFRTLILISLGSTLFAIISMEVGTIKDPVRLAANIVTGIGFLGAGAIFRESNRVQGLTTAASIWIAAAVGLSVGMGYYFLPIAVTLFSIIVLTQFHSIEIVVDKLKQYKTYEVDFIGSYDTCSQIQKDLTDKIPIKYTINFISISRNQNNFKLIFSLQASKEVHTNLLKYIAEDERYNYFKV